MIALIWICCIVGAFILQVLLRLAQSSFGIPVIPGTVIIYGAAIAVAIILTRKRRIQAVKDIYGENIPKDIEEVKEYCRNYTGDNRALQKYLKHCMNDGIIGYGDYQRLKDAVNSGQAGGGQNS